MCCILFFVEQWHWTASVPSERNTLHGAPHFPHSLIRFTSSRFGSSVSLRWIHRSLVLRQSARDRTIISGQSDVFTQGCQMAKFDRFPSLDYPGWRARGRNPRKGSNQILKRSVAEPYFFKPEGPNPFNMSIAIWQPCIHLKRAGQYSCSSLSLVIFMASPLDSLHGVSREQGLYHLVLCRVSWDR